MALLKTIQVTEDDYTYLKTKIVELNKIINDLVVYFKQTRNFTLDGRIVGDMGEMIAYMHYDIELDKKSRPKYDAIYKGIDVQIKCTMKDHLTFKDSDGLFLGLKINPKDGSFCEIYNGPAKIIHDHFKHRKDIGQKLLLLNNNKLGCLSAEIGLDDKIKTRTNQEIQHCYNYEDIKKAIRKNAA